MHREPTAHPAAAAAAAAAFPAAAAAVCPEDQRPPVVAHVAVWPNLQVWTCGGESVDGVRKGRDEAWPRRWQGGMRGRNNERIPPPRSTSAPPLTDALAGDNKAGGGGTMGSSLAGETKPGVLVIGGGVLYLPSTPRPSITLDYPHPWWVTAVQRVTAAQHSPLR